MTIHKKLKSLVMAASFIVLPTAMIYGAAEIEASNVFRQGLQFKVEDVADKDRNGSLSVDEMVEVCNVLNINPTEKFRKSFYLSVEESQKYLKNKGKYDSKTDSIYVFGKPHPYIIKAEAQDKYVRHSQF